MGSITSRARADGSIGYAARVRLREGQVVISPGDQNLLLKIGGEGLGEASKQSQLLLFIAEFRW